MARVNLEDRMFGESRLDRLAAKMGWPKPFAIGVLAQVWHESQEALLTHASAVQLADWTCLDEGSAARFVVAATACGYLVNDGGNLLKIQGNDVQIEHRVASLRKSAKGGEATKAKWAKLRSAEGSKPAPQPSPDRHNPDQTNPDQANANQTKARTRARARPRVDLEPADLEHGRDWLAFALGQMPWKATDASWTELRFAEALADVRAKVGLSQEGVAKLLEFVRKDEFWRRNAVSPMGLLRKSEKNGCRKVDNILVKMRTKGEAEAGSLQSWAAEEGAPQDPFAEVGT